MFRWYRNAEHCYVYLADVSVPVSNIQQSTTPWEEAFRKSKWFTRGWTLQELLAPSTVDFYSKQGTQLGDKDSLEKQIHDVTKIPILALREGAAFLDQFDIDERMKWAEKRETTLKEDGVYCLLGIFGVHMPSDYGEGRENALRRLRREIQDIPKRQDWLQKLYVCPYQERKDRNPRRVEKTCEWCTRHSLFQKWQMCSTSQLLWVSADPGCGKSVLARYLIDDVLVSTVSTTTFYFFFKDDFEDQRTTTTAMCSLLHHIFHNDPIAFSGQILAKFEDKGSTLLQSFHDLWDIFISATRGHKRHLIFVLDGLDECENHGQIQLINAISDFCSHTTTRSPVLKFLLLSRPYIHIKRRFQFLKHDLPTIHLAGDNEGEASQISHEIKLVIKSNVAEISRTLELDQEKQDILVEELLRLPNRTYLWIHLVFVMIQNSDLLTPGSIRSLVRNLPPSVSEVYDKILSKISDMKLARKLLHIVVGASRPLTLLETSLALAIKPQDQSITDVDSVPEELCRNYFRQLCGLFLNVVDSKVYLLHQTARGFLVSTSARSLSTLPSTTESQWKFSFHHEESHRILAEICIQRLSFADIEDFPTGARQDQKRQVQNDYFATRPLLEYAVRHWADHFRNANWKNDDHTFEKAVLYCYPGLPTSAWYSAYREITPGETPAGSSPVLIVSYFGLFSVLKRLSKKTTMDINVKDKEYGRSAISWATMKGYNDIVQRLLDTSLAQRLLGYGARLNMRDRHGFTPLALACKGGFEAIVQQLLEASADTNKPDYQGYTPLIYACKKGYNVVVQQLLEAGVDVNKKDNSDTTPLMHAFRDGHDVVLQQLLKAGADIDAKNNEGLTLLGYACKGGSDALVRQLIQAGAEVNTRNDEGITPLIYASMRGNDLMVQQLLQAGANVNTWEEPPKTALGVACYEGYDTIVQQLLQAGADVNLQHCEGTPLWHALRRGHTRIARQLSLAGAQIVTKTDRGFTRGTPAYRGDYNTIAHELLQVGAQGGTDIDLDGFDDLWLG